MTEENTIGPDAGLDPIVQGAVQSINVHVTPSFWTQLERAIAAGDAFKVGEPRAGVYTADNLETLSLVYGGKVNATT